MSAPTSSTSLTPARPSSCPSSAASSSSGSVSSYDDSEDQDEEERLAAQEEWNRLMDQTKMLLGLSVPFLAGFYGRKVGLRGQFVWTELELTWSRSRLARSDGHADQLRCAARYPASSAAPLTVFQRYLHLGLGKVFWFGWTGLLKGVGGVGLRR